MRELADKIARIVSAPVKGCTVHTFRFNGQLAETADGDHDFLTTREVSALLLDRAAEAAAEIVRAHEQSKDQSNG